MQLNYYVRAMKRATIAVGVLLLGLLVFGVFFDLRFYFVLSPPDRSERPSAPDTGNAVATINERLAALDVQTPVYCETEFALIEQEETSLAFWVTSVAVVERSSTMEHLSGKQVLMTHLTRKYSYKYRASAGTPGVDSLGAGEFVVEDDGNAKEIDVGGIKLRISLRNARSLYIEHKRTTDVTPIEAKLFESVPLDVQKKL